MDRDIAARRRRDLWRDYVYCEDDAAVPDDVDARLRDALSMILNCRRLAADAIAAGDADGALTHATNAMVVWQLLTEEGAAWMIEPLGERLSRCEPDQFNRELGRWHLQGLIDLFRISVAPSAWPAFSCLAPIMPAELFDKLQAALAALEAGDVKPLVAPKSMPKARRPDAWSHDMAIIFAVQHVAFLRGQGETVGAARQAVATALHVTVETLRSWEGRDLPKILGDNVAAGMVAIAEEAGRLQRLYDEDPDYGTRTADVVNGFAHETMLALRRHPLDAFGQSYRERFKASVRHWGASQRV